MRQLNKNKEVRMQETWVTIASMVVGYLMYLGVKSIFKK